MNLTEKQIETFIQFPDQLSEEMRKEVYNQIDSDPEAAAYFEWFKDYYSIYKELSKKEVNNASETVLSLKPMLDESESDPSVFVLAAQSTSGESTSIETLKTFVSEENSTLLRALYFKNKKEIKIHLLSNKVEKDDVLLFHIPEQNYLFTSNPGGKVSVNVDDLKPEDVKEWKSFNVHLPVCTVSHDSKQFNRSYLSGSSRFTQEVVPVEKETKGDIVQLTPYLNQSDSNCNYLVLFRENKSTLIKMTDGSAKIEQELLEADGVRLYFYN